MEVGWCNFKYHHILLYLAYLLTIIFFFFMKVSSHSLVNKYFKIFLVIIDNIAISILVNVSLHTPRRDFLGHVPWYRFAGSRASWTSLSWMLPMAPPGGCMNGTPTSTWAYSISSPTLGGVRFLKILADLTSVKCCIFV